VRLQRTIIAVAVAAVALTFVGSGAIAPSPGSAVARAASADTSVTVPDLTGLTKTVAASALTSATLQLGSVGTAWSKTAPVSTVITQSVAPGELVATGASIDVTVSLGPAPPPSSSLRLYRLMRITGAFSPKSVVASQHGYVFAQNMMYRHTISVLSEKTHRLVKTISDGVRLTDFGFTGHPGISHGGPVEAAMSPDGRYVYVSNYSMWGAGFHRPGHDVGSPASGFDRSFVYRIPLGTLKIDQVIRVGSVPKYLAVTPDGRYLLVSNWTSYTVSIVNTATGHQFRTIRVGRYPRGIAIDPQSRFAYVAIMGSNDVAKIDLADFSLHWLHGVGSSPRHLVMSPKGDFLYVTLNGSGRVAKVRLSTGKIVARVSTGSQPRSMTMAPDGRSLYVVNYESGTMSKVRTSDMHVIQTVRTDHHPIGITYVDKTREVWVSCYSGSVIVFRDR
jgi:YVTN family beta-propeller protein